MAPETPMHRPSKSPRISSGPLRVCTGAARGTNLEDDSDDVGSLVIPESRV